MREEVIELDCRCMGEREALHSYLQKALSLPAYYGRNLDALYDCLTDLGRPVLLRLTHTLALASLGAYGESLLNTFRDAQANDPELRVEFLMGSE